MRSVEKAFDKLEKDKKKLDKEARKRRNRDVWTVLAILASVMILALAIAWLKSGEAVAKKFVGDDPEQAKQLFETTRNVLFGAGFLSVVAVIIFVIKHIKYRKRPKVTNAFIDYDRLDAARARVEKARMEREGKPDVTRDRDNYDRYSEELHSNDRHNGMSEAEYRRMRQEEYERYMSMDFSEDSSRKSYGIDEENPELIETMSLADKIKDFISEHLWQVCLGASVIVVMIGAIIWLLMV